MLEQAIVDAEALREAALKNAEDMIVEKYSNQIKEAVEALLEQPEDPMALGAEEEGMGLEEPGLEMDPPEEDSALKDMPVVTVDGEKLCPCPEEEEEIEIDFDELTKKMQDEEGLAPPGESQEDLAADILGDEVPEDEPRALQEEVESLEEEIELDEDILSSILEELVVDIEPTSSGWGNNGVPTAHLDHAQEQVLARAQDTKVKEELEAMKKALEGLKLENKTHAKEKEEMKEVIYLLRDKLTESSLSSAKLLYTNKVLISDSLNERQKIKLSKLYQ